MSELGGAESISDILFDTVQKIFGIDDNNSDSPFIMPYGVSLLELIAIILIAIMFVLLTLSLIAIRSGKTLNELINFFTSAIIRRIKANISKKVVIANAATSDSHDYYLKSAEYLKDVQNLADVALNRGHEHDEYINTLNSMSKRYGVNIANIIYDEWSIRSGFRR
jgi:hypothetical protein